MKKFISVKKPATGQDCCIVKGFVVRTENTPFKFTQGSGERKSVLRFKTSYTPSYKDKQGVEHKDASSQWVEFTAFGEKAEELNSALQHNMLIEVGCKVEQKTYEKDGVTKYVTEFTLCGFVNILHVPNNSNLKQWCDSNDVRYMIEDTQEEEF